MFDLLIERIVPVETGGDGMMLTLPELFSQLGRDTIDGFPGLAAHQAQAWYQFLAQLGALALHRGHLREPPQDPDAWRRLLADLTPSSAATAWSLMVENPTRPAFLQPPTGMLHKFKPAGETPDALDVLVTAKNHDRKRAQAIHGEPHLWLYALITLQTTQGYSGRGNPGIARMNGGLSSRVLVDRRPGPRWGPRVARAMRMLLVRRSEILRLMTDDLYQSEGGLALTWLHGWDTDEPLRIQELDPFFIEICRRVRLTATGKGRLAALARPAKTPRVAAQALKGNLGDPWTPVNLSKSAPSSLTVGGNGFNYRLAQLILFERKLKKPLSLKTLPGENRLDSEVHMGVLVRGQGKTEGLHERIIPLPESVAPYLQFDEDEQGSPLAALSQDMVALAGEARKVLWQTVQIYLQGPEHPKFRKPDAAPTIASYDQKIDEEFFNCLFEAPKIGSDEVILRWQLLLRDEAFRLARDVWHKRTPPNIRREKARAASEAVLFAGLRKRLPEAFLVHDSKEPST